MQQEVIHPNWPTLWPRLLTDGKLLVSLFVLFDILLPIPIKEQSLILLRNLIKLPSILITFTTTPSK